MTWAIGKAAGSLTLAKSSVTLNISSLTESVAVTRAGDGVISATSSNTATARVEVSGTSVKITGLKAGTAKITVKVAAGTNHTAPSDKTINVTVSLPDTSLANNTPDIIAAAAKSGQAANYWSVGDKVGIAVNGSFGGLSYNNTVYAFILGFNHNSSVEGGNSIHFQSGKTAAGVDIAFVNSYGSTSTGFCMNTSNTNSGGWNNSYMRKTICPAFLAALPTAWQNIIAACTKYSDNTGGGSNTASYVTATSDKIWLLSEMEVQGTRSYANSAEANYQKQYDYYRNGNSKVKYQHTATTSACSWWLRSVNASNTNNFCNVNTDGSANNNNAYNSNGFAPGFKNNLGPEQVANCEAVPQTLKENLTLGDWSAMRGLHSLNHHSIRRPGRFLHGRGFTAALPRLHEQPLCSYFKPLRQTTQVREVMRPANRAPDRTLYGWDTALEAT